MSIMNPANNFTDVYDEYVDKIYRFVFVRVNSKAAAQDLTSETFTRTLEYMNSKLMGSDPVKIDNIQAFLYRTARNIVTDYYRQKSRTDVPLDYDSQEMVEREMPYKDRPDIAAAHGEQVGEVRLALAKMDKDRADIVMWHYIEDMPIREIADITGRPEGTVRVMLHRGLKELRDNL